MHSVLERRVKGLIGFRNRVDGGIGHIYLPQWGQEWLELDKFLFLLLSFLEFPELKLHFFDQMIG